MGRYGTGEAPGGRGGASRPPDGAGRRLARALGVAIAWMGAAGAAAPGQETPASRPASPPDARELRPLGLEEAIDEALAGNPALRIAAAESGMAAAEARASTARLLPRLDVAGGWMRSVDPVAAFGTRLRQGTFGPEDLAIDALNDPDPVTDFHGTADARWSPLDPALWAGRSAARSRATAAEWMGDRTREATVFRTKALYYRAAGAEARVGAAEAAEEAARATHALFRRRHEEGVLTRADLLQAESELRAAEAGAAEAWRQRAHAREELGLHLGWDPSRVPVPADTLAPVEPPTPAAFEPARRADVRALEAFRAAARADARRADAAFLPAVDVFAAYATHASDPFDSDGTDWTVGAGVRWNLFAGLGRVADGERADRAAEVARLRHEDALRTARVEVEQAGREVETARRRMEAMTAAQEAAREGRDLLRRRLEEGLATPSEYLQAQARAAAMRARAVEAVADYDVAVARLEYVTAAGYRTPGEDR